MCIIKDKINQGQIKQSSECNCNLLRHFIKTGNSEIKTIFEHAKLIDNYKFLESAYKFLDKGKIKKLKGIVKTHLAKDAECAVNPNIEANKVNFTDLYEKPSTNQASLINSFIRLIQDIEKASYNNLGEITRFNELLADHLATSPTLDILEFKGKINKGKEAATPLEVGADTTGSTETLQRASFKKRLSLFFRKDITIPSSSGNTSSNTPTSN